MSACFHLGFFSIPRHQVGVRRVYRVALAFGVAVFILRDIHDKSRDGTHGGVGARAVAYSVLGFLVVGFPAPSQLEACRLAVQGLVDKGFHRPPLQMAAERETGLSRKQRRNTAKRNRLEEERDLI